MSITEPQEVTDFFNTTYDAPESTPQRVLLNTDQNGYVDWSDELDDEDYDDFGYDVEEPDDFDEEWEQRF